MRSVNNYMSSLQVTSKLLFTSHDTIASMNSLLGTKSVTWNYKNVLQARKLQERQDKFKSKHEKKIRDRKCDECGKVLKTPNLLDIHKRHAHLTVKPQCQLCAKSFTTKSGLSRHTKNIHERKMPWYCKICGKTFRAKAFLTDHYFEEHKDSQIVLD